MQTWASVDVPRLAGGGPPLRLYDTATGEGAARPRPGAPRRCTSAGSPPTTPPTSATPRPTWPSTWSTGWRDLGHDVHYVQNVTDIDDPLLERAARDQDDWVVLGMRETALFREDMAALRVLPPRDYIGAVEAMGEIAELVGKLLAAGAAYRVDDPRVPRRLLRPHRHRALRLRVQLRRGDHAAAVRRARRRPRPARQAAPARPAAVAHGPRRASRPGTSRAGRRAGPGWHVECAAIALNRLGPQIDLRAAART